MDKIPWEDEGDAKCYLYSAQFTKGEDSSLHLANRYILAAGGAPHKNEMKLFETSSHKEVAAVRGLQSTVYSADMSKDGSMVAFGGSGKGLMLFDWDDQILLDP